VALLSLVPRKRTADLSTTVEMTILLKDRNSVSGRGPRNCRSLGFARDDKKERVVGREKAVAGGKGGFLKERA
jgi:hypothetical protein